MIRILSLLIFTLVSFGSFSQTNAELLKMGDAAMVNGQYTNAVYYYAFILYKVKQGEEAAYYPYEITTTYKEPKKNEQGNIVPPANPTKKEISLINKLASAYLNADDYENAELWYQAAINYTDPEFKHPRYYYGLSLMYNEKFEEAKVQFEQYQTENGDPEDKFYQESASKIVSCQFALNPANSESKIELIEVSSDVNKGTANYGTSYVADNYILYSSARTLENVNDSLTNPLEKFLLDLYLAPINADGSIGQAERLPYPLNSQDFHEGNAVLAADGNTIYFTRMNPDNRNETKIYGGKKINGNWLEPYLLDPHVNVDGFRSLSPSLSNDGEKLYFSSDRPGGEGGLDLWYVKLTPDGQTGRAINLGNAINTSGDEISSFFHAKSQTLYFSSTGHIGFGGEDIYYSIYDAETDVFKQANNLGAPVNSSADDNYYIIDEKLQNGFFTSNRDVCSECDSIYSLNVHCNKLYQFRSPEIRFSIKGYVYDKTTKEIIPNAKIEFKDVSYAWAHFEIYADENGYYEHELIPDLELFMRATQTDYFADKAIIITIGETESKVFTQDFYLEKIPKGEITIEGIEYDFDSANLRPESMLILDNLIEFLELNDNLVIEIRSHTDQRGNDDYNLRLSERRAQSVVDYLVAHNIPIERLKPKGYGETMPAEITNEAGEVAIMTIEYIADLATKAEREVAHQRNRRTAFFVLEQK